MHKAPAQWGEPAGSRAERLVEAYIDGPETGSINQLLSEYYRCPANLVEFLVARPPVTQHPGHFQMGADTICYGHICSGQPGRHPVGELHDALADVVVAERRVELPFDVAEVVENLRRERYTAHFREEGHFFNEILRKVYYLVRPLLGVAARRHLQRIRLRDWNRLAFPKWPLDCTVERIHQKLLALYLKTQNIERIPFIWFWPEGYSSCAIMTHDVEETEGKEFCGKLMDLDQSFGIASAFQLVPENRYSVERSFVDSITCRGFEVNVHDLKHDGRLYADHAEFLRRAKRINSYVKEFGAEGFRSGILYRNADWYDAFQFSYDMSIPNVAHLDPQRGGCCTVMPYFIGNIVELPVTCTQDYTLFQILDDYSIDLWKQQIALVQENYGLISLIVHPDYIMEPRAQSTYRALLTHLSTLRDEGGVWTALPRDVAAWWRERSQLKLVQRDGEWCVEGTGKERARVAYASLCGDSVRYSLEN
jgi:hypothetical protein